MVSVSPLTALMTVLGFAFDYTYFSQSYGMYREADARIHDIEKTLPSGTEQEIVRKDRFSNGQRGGC